MSLIVDSDGTISLYQGDSGELVIYGLDKNKNYTVYLAIQNKNREIIGEELQVSVNNSDNVTFVFSSKFTDLLDVPSTKPYEIYFYGIKACDIDNLKEDTLFIGNNTYGDLNRIIVYPRKVKGV